MSKLYQSLRSVKFLAKTRLNIFCCLALTLFLAPTLSTAWASHGPVKGGAPSVALPVFVRVPARVVQDDGGFITECQSGDHQCSGQGCYHQCLKCVGGTITSTTACSATCCNGSNCITVSCTAR